MVFLEYSKVSRSSSHRLVYLNRSLKVRKASSRSQRRSVIDKAPCPVISVLSQPAKKRISVTNK